jgi:hypothetical protein
LADRPSLAASSKSLALRIESSGGIVVVFCVVGNSLVCVGDVGGGTGSTSTVLGSAGRFVADDSRKPINLSLGRSSIISGACTSL